MMLDELPGPEIRYQGPKSPYPVLHPGEKPPAYRILKSEERSAGELPNGTYVSEWMECDTDMPPEAMEELIDGEVVLMDECLIDNEGADLVPHPLPPTQHGELVLTPPLEGGQASIETAYKIQECLRVARIGLGEADFGSPPAAETYRPKAEILCSPEVLAIMGNIEVLVEWMEIHLRATGVLKRKHDSRNN